MITRNYLLAILLVILLPRFVQSRQVTTEISWGEYTPPEGKTVLSFVLFRGQNEVCRWDTPEETGGDCTFDVRRRIDQYTMAVMFTDGTYSPRTDSVSSTLYNRISFKGKLLKLGKQQ